MIKKLTTCTYVYLNDNLGSLVLWVEMAQKRRNIAEFQYFDSENIVVRTYYIMDSGYDMLAGFVLWMAGGDPVIHSN